MSIHIICECSRKLSAPERFAGRKVKCPDCGSVVQVPAPPAKPRTRRRASNAKILAIQSDPTALPGTAVTLTVLSFLDAIVVGLLALVIALLGGLTGAMGEATGALTDPVETMADTTIRMIVDQGGKIVEDSIVVTGDGKKSRRVVYENEQGRGSYLFPIKEKKQEEGQDISDFGQILFLVGIGLMIVAVGKIGAGIGFLMKKNWGRVSMMALAGVDAALILIFVLIGASGAGLLLSMLLNISILVLFATRPVRLAMA